MSDLTRMLTAITEGRSSPEVLLPVVYAELRRLAAQKLSHERPGQTLQPTALVHEAWMRLAGDQRQYRNSRHFFLAAAEAMRRILVDIARRKRRPKHGGHMERVEIGRVEIGSPLPGEEVLAVDEALDRLAVVNPRAAEIVKLRFFAGLTAEEIAESCGVSAATVGRTWAFARAWLYDAITHPMGNLTKTAPQKRL